MFSSSGFSVAMRNAFDEVKAQAVAVTDSCAITDSYNDEASGKAIENFILGHVS
jgi:hydroxymethylpyrimidine pyrophosphatase-like HAD family hydrolase